MNRGPYCFGSIVKQEQFDRRRKPRLERGKQLSNLIDDLDRIRARLARYGQDNAAGAIVPRNRLVVFDTVDDVCEFLETQRDSFAPFDDEWPVRRRLHQLAARLHCECLLGSVQPAGGQVHIALLHRALHFVDSDLMRCKLVRIGLNAHGVFLGAIYLHAGDAADCGQTLGQDRFRVLVDRV